MTRRRTPALPESAVMRQCADYALMRGALVIRVNAGAMPTPDGRWFRALVRNPGRDFNDGWLCSPWTQANVFAAWVINRRNAGGGEG